MKQLMDMQIVRQINLLQSRMDCGYKQAGTTKRSASLLVSAQVDRRRCELTPQHIENELMCDKKFMESMSDDEL